MTDTSDPRITLCGRLTLNWDGDELGERLPGRQGRLLFAYLVLNRHRPVRRDELVEALWADEGLPSGGEGLLAPPLSRLRKTLGPGRLEGRSELGLVLGEQVWIDWEAAQAGIEQARGLAATGENRSVYDQALAAERILSGGLLPGLEAGWIDDYRHQMEDLLLQALELIARSGSRLGEAERARGERAARAAVEAAPFRESARTALIEAIEAQGNIAEALRVYEEFRILLRDELGTFPAPDLNAIHERLLKAHQGRPDPAVGGVDGSAGRSGATDGRAGTVTRRQATPEEIGRMIDPRIAAIGLVGRADILSQLNAELDLAVAGDLRIALLAGEGGIGKTRIAAELAAGRDDVTVLYGRSEPDEIRPYRLWTGLLRSAMRQAGDIELADIVAGDGPILARILPELVGSMELPAPGPAGDLESERRALFDAVMRMIGRLTARKPMLIVLDDLHWADRSTLLLLAGMAGDNPPGGVLALGTYRDTELPADSLLPETLANLQRRLPTLKLEVDALDADDIGRLIDDRLDVSHAASLQDQTGGNPFLIEQLVRHLEETGTDDLSRAPAEVRQIVSQRVAHLPEGGTDLLRRAALIGRDFDLPILLATTSLDEDQVIDLLDAAVAAGLLDESQTIPGRFSFVHALLRSTLEEELSLTRRAVIHRDIGEAIERQTVARPERQVGEKAWHFAQAGPAEADRAVYWATQAAAQAEDRLAYDEAVGFYEAAIGAARADEPADQGLLARLLLDQAKALWKNGALQEAGDAFAEAARTARESGLPELAAEAALGTRWGGWDSVSVDMGEQIGLLRDAHSGLPPEATELRAGLAAALAQILYFAGQADQAREFASEARGLIAEVAQTRAEFDVLQGTAFIRWQPGNAKRRLPEAERMVELARELDDDEMIGQALISRLPAHINVGDREAALADSARIAELSETMAQFRVTSRVIEAAADFLRGDWAEGEQLTDELTAEGLPLAAMLLLLDSHGFMVLAQQGRVGEQIDRLSMMATATEDWEMGPTWRLALLLARAQSGQATQVKAELGAEGVAGIEFTPEGNITYLSACAVANLLIGELGDRGSAPTLAECFAPYSGEWIVVTRIGSTLGPVDMHLGELYELAGDHDRAASALELSLVTCEAMNAVPYLARTKLALASALDGIGDPASEERRVELRREGEEAARKLGMRAILDRHLSI